MPVIGWSPIACSTFVRAFKRLIESRTSSSTEKLYYLEQFPAGGVQEVVESCHHLPPDEGYNEACMLLRKKFGNEYHMAFSYETKALDWPNIRGENGAALERFSIFLESCTGAVSGSRYSLRFDQPGNIQKLVLKLPYNLRERWLRRANDIIELQSKPMDFSDLITFVDLEASIVTNPVFDRISDSVKPATGQRSCGGKTALKEPENFSFLTQIDGCECSPSETGLPDASEPSACGYREPSWQSHEVQVPGINPISSRKKRRCLYCNSNNALEDCLPLRWKPYQEIIQFLASNKLYFGCLSNQHISRLCPRRKTCEIANCSRKHRSILHTSPGEKHTTDVGVGTDDNVDAQVRGSMVNIARMPNVRPYTKVAGQSWLWYQSKWGKRYW